MSVSELYRCAVMVIIIYGYSMRKSDTAVQSEEVLKEESIQYMPYPNRFSRRYRFSSLLYQQSVYCTLLILNVAFFASLSYL